LIEKKNKILVICFFVVLYGVFIAFFVMNDSEISISERRKLAVFPEISAENLFSGELMDQTEKYLLDQFPARDTFRRIKAHICFDILKKKDNKGIYLVDNGIYKLEYPLNKQQVLLGAQKLNELYDTYLSGMNVYYAVIPDKNYYVAQENGYLEMDYNQMLQILRSNIKNIKEIELFDCLGEDDYYRTDLHWKQENLNRIVERLSETLHLKLKPWDAYTKEAFSPFYGAYFGQSALDVPADEIVYLTNNTINNAYVYNMETDSMGDVYSPEACDGLDAYNIFLSGSAAFLTIENNMVTSGRELVIFRDSFASSLAPLLLDGYSKITLIDLRYMSSDLLPQLITFTNQDVLFLYSTLVFNNSAMLR
jgi:hypothetical protein